MSYLSFSLVHFDILVLFGTWYLPSLRGERGKRDGGYGGDRSKLPNPLLTSYILAPTSHALGHFFFSTHLFTRLTLFLYLASCMLLNVLYLCETFRSRSRPKALCPGREHICAQIHNDLVPDSFHGT